KFPDGTNPAVVDRVVKEHLSQNIQSVKQSVSQSPSQKAATMVPLALRVGVPAAAGIGVGALTGSPVAGDITFGGMDEILRHLYGEKSGGMITGTLNQDPSLIGAGEQGLENVFLGRLMKSGLNLASEIVKPGSVVGPGLSELNPTGSQYYQNAPFFKFLENTLAPKTKAEAVKASNILATEKGNVVASGLAGQKIKLEDKNALADLLQEQTKLDFSQFSQEAQKHCEVSQLISKQNIQQISFGNGFRTIEGPINTDNLVNKALEIRNQLSKPLGKPDPSNPLIADIDEILKRVNAKFDPKGNLISYQPIS